MAGWWVNWFIGWLAILNAVQAPILQAPSEPEPVVVEWQVGAAPDGGWTAGDRIPLRLSATYPADLQTTLPELPTLWGPFEVLEQTLLPPMDNGDGTLTIIRQATVTLWAPGEYETPPLTARYRVSDPTSSTDDDQLYQVAVSPISVTVVSVLTGSETEKRDLKPQISLPRPPVWPWILGGMLGAGLAGLAGWFLLTRLHRRPLLGTDTMPQVAARPPHEIAYAELTRIEAMELPARGELKRHYTLIADCVRSYAQGRYHIPALDQTTEEFLAALRRTQVGRASARLFRELLTEADLVKFAKSRPPVEQARDAVTQARHIVDVTKDG